MNSVFSSLQHILLAENEKSGKMSNMTGEERERMLLTLVKLEPPASQELELNKKISFFFFLTFESVPHFEHQQIYLFVLIDYTLN